MKRFLIPALAVAALATAPHLASAQNSGQSQTRNYNNNGATAWGDPWLNENDFDYNRRHWLPNRQGSNENYDRSRRDENRYGTNDRNDDRYGGNSYRNNDRYGYNGDYGRDQDRRYYRDDRDRPGLGRDYRPYDRYDQNDDE